MIPACVRASLLSLPLVDGYIARANGSIDWLSIVHPVDEAHGYETFMSSVDTIVIGRRTYETVLEYQTWPYFGKRLIVTPVSCEGAAPGGVLFGLGTKN